MSNIGYIKLWRKFASWEWHDDSNVVNVFIHCLIFANWQENKWHGETIARGEFLTTMAKLGVQTGLTPRQVKNCLDKLSKSGEVVLKSKQGKRYTIIRVCNYDEYQECQSDVNEMSMKCQSDVNEMSKLGKSDVNEMSILKEYNNIKNDKKEKNVKKDKEVKHIYGEYKNVRLTDNELDKLKQEYGTKTADECITYLDEYIEMKGYKAKSHYLCIRKWVVDAVNRKTQKKQNDKNDLSWIDDIQ